MIELTSLNYKIKPEALERSHRAAEYNAEKLFLWDKEIKIIDNMGIDSGYIEKPYVEPFEFEDKDYTFKERGLRVAKTEIQTYSTNADDVTEITLKGGIMYFVKETLEEIDNLLR